MKILYHILYPEGYGDDRFIYDGYRGAFWDMGHAVVPLTERDNVEEMIRREKPDIFMAAINQTDFMRDAAILKEFRRNGGRVLVRAGNIKPQHLEERPEFFKPLVKLIQSNEAGDLYYSEVTTPYFKELTGHECRLLPLAADRHIHFPTNPQKRYECDVLYIGANLPMKQPIFKRRLFPLFKKYRVKVFGGDWDLSDRYILHPLAKIDRTLNLGGVFSRLRISRQVPLAEENVAYSSAKICLNFHEQYTDHFFLNARGFKIPASGGFEICDWMPVLRDYFSEDEMIMPETDEEFFKAVDYYVTHDGERKAMQERATARTLKEHTWNNRAETLLSWYKNLA